MTLNPWTILNTPRIQLTLLDEAVLGFYALAVVAVLLGLFVWWSSRR